MTKPATRLGQRLRASGVSPETGPNRLVGQLHAAVRIARTTGPMLRRRSARVVAGTRSGLRWTTRAVQAMPNSTNRLLATGSVGLGAGLYMGGAPRLVAAAGVAPAAVIGAAILLRPNERVVASKAAS
jgi:hypothetical protein